MLPTCIDVERQQHVPAPPSSPQEPRIRILYLTCFEYVVNSGIFESQVKGYLSCLAAKKASEVQVSQLAIRPAVIIGRDGISLSFRHEREWFRALTQNLAGKGIDSQVSFVPVLLPKRWKFYFPLPIALVVMALTVPLLLFKVARARYDVIHCRSYVATLCALIVSRVLRRPKVVFDMRGFYPEEGLIQRSWRARSLSYSFWKRIERFLIRNAHYTIALSDVFQKRVADGGAADRCALIFAGTDVRKFRDARQYRDQIRAELGITSNKVFAYAGGLGSWHDPALLAKIGTVLRRNISNAALLILTPYDKQKLQQEFMAAGVEETRVTILSVKPDQVPRYLAAADFGIVPLRDLSPDDPAVVVAETMIGLKVAEYLAAGLPIIVNDRVGGLRSLMSKWRIGEFFNTANCDAVAFKVQAMLSHYYEYQQNCREVANEFLSLDVAAAKYYDVYRSVLDRRGNR